MSALSHRSVPLLGLLAVVASFALAACPQPHPADGSLACSATGECPQGYRCDNGACRSGASGGADLARGDLAGVDLANRAGQCEQYCTCMLANCPANLRPQFDSTLTCASYCAALPAGAQMDCRILHCALALSAGDTLTHCPHALGMVECVDR